MANIKDLTEENFEESVKSGVTLIDFYAEWCGPCRMLSPVIEELAGEETNVQFMKVDVDTAQKLATNHQITSVPTLVLYKDGKEVDRILGLRDKQALKSFVSSVK